jgi:hypothetical protein
MTELLEKAFAEVTKLPEAEQNAVARWLLAELAAERRWQDLFDSRPDVLAQLADDALAEYERGETESLESLLDEDADLPQ